MAEKLTHLRNDGTAHMVDVSAKAVTAAGSVPMLSFLNRGSTPGIASVSSKRLRYVPLKN